MIYILHGDNLAKSRDFVLNLERSLGDCVKFEFRISEVAPEKIEEAGLGVDMFDRPKLIVIDISGVGRTNLTDYKEAVKKIAYNAIVVVLSGSELTKGNEFLRSSQEINARVVLNKIPTTSNIFAFIDAVAAKNRNSSYLELKKLLISGEDDIYLLTMLEYGLRNLAYASFASKAFSRIPPFAKMKVQNAASRYSRQDIKEIYKYFYDLDLKAKTGGYPDGVLVPLAIEKMLT